MSVDVDEVRALAHAFARTLAHLREFRSVAYVGAAALPIITDVHDGPGEHADEADEAEAEPDPLTDARGSTAADPRGPMAPRSQPSAPTDRGPAREYSLPESRSAHAADAPSRERSQPPARPQPYPPTREQAMPPRPRPTEQNRPAPQSTYSRERPQSPPPGNHSGPARTESGPARTEGRAARTEPRSSRPVAPARGSSDPQQWPAAKKLAYLRERNVGDCRRCALAGTRRNIVFGVGDPEADVMFVGEAPGADEDRLGEPFVGAAGRRLDQWIERVGLRRADVYIANVLKCRPPGNRDPHPVEIERCSPFLHAQIRAIEPKVLIALGRFAGCLLLERDLKLWEMRGKVHGYREPKSGVEIPLIVTYHPAYVLRSEQRPPTRPAETDRGGAIKSEDDKVMADIDRAVSLARGRT